MRVDISDILNPGRGTVAVIMILVVVMSTHQYVAGADPNSEQSSPGGEQDPRSRRIIGNYTINQEQMDLTTYHTQHLTHGLRVFSHPDAENLRIDPQHIYERLGPWSSQTPYTLTGEGHIQVDQSTAHFQSLHITESPVFTQGSIDTVLLEKRPMWIHLTKNGNTVTLHFNHTDTSGQNILLSHEFLQQYGIHRPIAHHTDGTSLNSTPDPNGQGYWVEMPHFSGVQLSPADIAVLGRQLGVTFNHDGDVIWNATTRDLYIEVDEKLTDYELLVEQAWFNTKMPHLALKNHSWYEDTHDDEKFYVVALTPDETPTTLHYQEFRLTPTPVFTYGSPSLIQAHPFNQTLREERGPMWVETHENTTRIDVRLEASQGGPYEVLASHGWLDQWATEDPRFAENATPLPVQPRLTGDWTIEFEDKLNLEIYDSKNGPLILPGYERIPGGLIKHNDGCGLHHFVKSTNGTITHDAPACLNATTLHTLQQQATESHFLHASGLFSSCAVYHDTTNNDTSLFVVAPCEDFPGPSQPLPSAVQNLCDQSDWGEKAHQAFCEQGIHRYQAAGLSLDVSSETGAVLADVAFYYDHIMDWERVNRANETLPILEEWQEKTWDFSSTIGWQGPCRDALPSLFMVPQIPEKVCDRPINEYETEEGTVVLPMDEVQQDWDALYEHEACSQRERVIVLNGFQDAYCGNQFPLVRNATDAFLDLVDWEECDFDSGFLGLGLGGNGTSGEVCASILTYPSDPQAAAAWDEVRSWEACKREVTFSLYPEGDVPHALCAKVLTTADQEDFSEVFSYVNQQGSCGQDDVPILVVGGPEEGPVVVCGEIVQGLGTEWEEHWAYLVSTSPCSGQSVFLVDNRTMGRLCGEDYQVNNTIWSTVMDKVAEAYCLEPGGLALLALTDSDPVVVCAKVLPSNESTWGHWETLAGSVDPCGLQVLMVPGNQSAALDPEGELCGTRVPQLGTVIDGLRDWESQENRCGQRLESVLLRPGGPAVVCGMVLDNETVQDLLEQLDEDLACENWEHGLLGFSRVPLAICGEPMIEGASNLAGLQQQVLDSRVCEFDEPPGEEFCSIPLPDPESDCPLDPLVGGECVVHRVWENEDWVERAIPLGYPVFANGTTLWMVGGPEFASGAGCDEETGSCSLQNQGLRGVMVAYGGEAYVGDSWIVHWGEDTGEYLSPRFAKHPDPWRLMSDNFLSLIDPWGAQAPAMDAFDPAWRPWLELSDVSPYEVPETTAELYGYRLPENKCAGTAPGLEAAVEGLGEAIGLNLTPLGDVVEELQAWEKQELAQVIDCISAHVPRILEEASELEAPPGELAISGVDGLEGLEGLIEQGAELPMGPSVVALATLRDLLSVLEDFPDFISVPLEDSPHCVDQKCLIQLGGPGDDEYEQDAILILDEEGNDTFFNNAGGAYPRLFAASVVNHTLNGGSVLSAPVSIVLNQGDGNDNYVPELHNQSINIEIESQNLTFRPYPSIGAGWDGGVGILIDEGGDDFFSALGVTMGAASGPIIGGLGKAAGFLLSYGGNDTFFSEYEDGPNPGTSNKVTMAAASLASVAFLINREGDDYYHQEGLDSIGWGGTGSLGALIDQEGNDNYTNDAAPSASSDRIDIRSGVSLGSGEIGGGSGILLDMGGIDSIECGTPVWYACIGGGFTGSLGMFYSHGGNNSYVLGEPYDNSAQGLGSGELGALGILFDRGGNDKYVSDSPHSGGSGHHSTRVGLGLFFDGGGKDTYGFSHPPHILGIVQPSEPPPEPFDSREDDRAWLHNHIGLGIDCCSEE